MVINRQFGDYTLLQRLAIGGQSEVFLALKTGPQTFTRPLVIKALPSEHRADPKYLELFYREAFVSARFAHPNLINVHDARVLGDEHFMVMDYVSGQTVSDIAQRGYQTGRPLDLNQVVQIIADACSGLQYVHKFRDLDDTAYSIVHCDISPQNLMVTYDGVTKVFDFGIARILRGDSDANENLAGGKYAYMSPEQCRGEPFDSRSDIFSLGIILYELTTGFRLFRRGTNAEVINAVTEDEIQPPGELSPNLPVMVERCIMKALARNPNERYQTAAQLRDDLLEYLQLFTDGRASAQLGPYVSELFAEDRRAIVEVIREATQTKAATARPLNGTALGDIPLGTEEFESQTMEFHLPAGLQSPVADDGQATMASVEQEIEDEEKAAQVWNLGLDEAGERKEGEESTDDAPGDDDEPEIPPGAEDESKEEAPQTDDSKNESEDEPGPQAEVKDVREDQSEETPAEDERETKASAKLIPVDDEFRARHERAVDVANTLTREVLNLQKRQNFLILALCIVSLLAAAIGYWSYEQQSRSAESAVTESANRR